MAAYYNEIEPYAAAWLRNLIAAGHIAPGDVDTRDIRDVRPDDLRGYKQCHFFAGVGVWSHSLRRAVWSDDRPVWTGSCPCQPFSAAGAGLGFSDERHLWPHFFHLIRECGPAVVLGEQVASKDVDPWVDLVQADMEGVGYAFGAIPFPAASVGAPNIRDRLYWVATDRMADTDSTRPHASAFGGIHRSEEGAGAWNGESERLSATSEWPGQTNGYWRDADWLLCRDGKWRPVESGTFPLAHGASARVGRLRAYGNAINAEAARHFIESVMECI